MLPVALLVVSLGLAAQAVPPDCREWHECRTLTLDAIATHDYERAHDLAWRTVQTGPKNDPDLMYLLARAQSLSGRWDDALVMLGRLAGMGVPTDAATSDDFVKLRGLPAWTALQGRIRTVAAASPAARPRATAPTWTAGLFAPAASAALAPAAPAPSASVTPRALERAPAEDTFQLPPTPFRAAGLAYDQVSARFVLADPGGGKLVIVDERSRHVVDLVEAASAGFGEITALEIDPRRGDLWVVSTGVPGDDGPVDALHKLQLVSGRPLRSIPLPGRFGPARFVDVAVSPGGTVFVLDSTAGRIFSLKPGSTRFDVAATLPLRGASSIAPAGDRAIYVAHRDGIARVELGSRDLVSLNGPAGVPLTGFERLRWDRDCLVGVQKVGDERRVIRLRLSRSGRAVASAAVADADVQMPDPRAATIADHAFYYLAEDHGAGGAPAIVRRVPLP